MSEEYSIVKARALTDAEIKSIDNQLIEYIDENYDGTGYKLFSGDEKDFYHYLGLYMRSVRVYKRIINPSKVRIYFSIPPSFNVNIQEENNKAKVIFEDFYGKRIVKYVPMNTAKTLFMERQAKGRFAAYVEPILSIGTTIGKPFAEDFKFLGGNGNVASGYFPLNKAMLDRIHKKIPEKDWRSFIEQYQTKESTEAIFFHTFELPLLK